MNILALEPFYGGSHKAFLDGCSAHSKHDWTLLTLPAYKWKWRMRHSPATFAQETQKLLQEGKKFDLIFCSDMLPLAEFKGLVDNSIAKLPSIIYFHENQLTYPVQSESERDLHFALTNYLSMIASDQVWFNSQYHRDSFFNALQKFLLRMPDFNLLDMLESVKQKSSLFPQAINRNPFKKTDKIFVPPIHIGWVARWEFDKNPELFFAVLKNLKSQNIPFKLSVLGEQFENSPPIFEEAKKEFKDEIINYGYLPTQSEYQKVLADIDIVISTADHEFFGISIMEAIESGAYPLLPNKLSYPELLNLSEQKENEKFFYNCTEQDLTEKLIKVIEQFNSTTVSFDLQEIADQYYWTKIAILLDNRISELHQNLNNL